MAVFFSAGVGLHMWDSNGSMRREMALYDKLSKELAGIDLITYGGPMDDKYIGTFGDVAVHPTAWIRRPHRLARYFMPVNSFITRASHKKLLERDDILKTNQISGSEIAVAAKKKFRKKLVIRCGYVGSRLHDLARRVSAPAPNTGPEGSIKNSERDAFGNADAVIVTTREDKDWVIKNYGVAQDVISVIPNYVETDKFLPVQSEKKYDLAVVSRDSPEKNIGSLLEAISELKKKGTNLSMIMVGSCGMSRDVAEAVSRNGLSITAIGNVDNDKLPAILAQARVFLMPSFYEGNPKVLLEAMSCGLACIGADRDNINRIISHGRTGYLCGTDSTSIADALAAVLGDAALRESIGGNARKHIEDNFSLSNAVRAELDVLRRLAR